MKLVTNKPQQEIAVEACTDDKVYVGKGNSGTYILTAIKHGSGTYKWIRLDESFTGFNGIVKTGSLTEMLSYLPVTYQFDTMREAMLFVFGEKEVDNGK